MVPDQTRNQSSSISNSFKWVLVLECWKSQTIYLLKDRHSFFAVVRFSDQKSHLQHASVSRKQQINLNWPQFLQFGNQSLSVQSLSTTTASIHKKAPPKSIQSISRNTPSVQIFCFKSRFCWPFEQLQQQSELLGLTTFVMASDFNHADSASPVSS